eukprot:GFUD01036901.1.p1 GENE.GFUD01036901.1~~GFUD01036901.1.p1  ORF type:complete len:718 (+),score=219.33 GFUD01036901.1:58-2154(+)
MERQGRRELLEVISQQKEQLTKYETRLKDVVRAYKGLAKEKETLEASLKAITAAVNEEKETEKQTTDTECETDTESIAESTGSDFSSATAKPKAKLAALSNSLAAVTAEKSQSEAKFLADKRKMRKEKDELNNELEKVQKSEAELKVSFEETKSKLIIERHEREKEMNNNKLMVQELQKLFTDERNEKEKLTDELLDLKSKVILLEDPSKNRQYENHVQKLKQELESARMQIVKAEKQLKDQNVTEQKISTLRTEMNDLKQKHLEQLQNAESAREKAELRALEIQSQQEKRVGNLESRLQELSESVGSYEKLRTQDQTAISSMREELETLNHENIALARSASTEPPKVEKEEKLNFQRIVDKVIKYKKILVDAEDAELENLQEVFMLPGQEDFQVKCKLLQEKLENLDRDKTSPGRFDEFLNNTNQVEQINTLKAATEDLKAKITLLKQRNADLESDLNDKHLRLLEQKQQFEKEKEGLRLDNKKQLISMRLEFQEHRERSLTLLDEKDEEIHKLRNQVEMAVEETFYSPPDRNTREKSKSPLQAIPRKISVDMIEFNKQQHEGSSGPPLHYVQELARKEVEIKELRAQKYQSETGLREIQLNMSTKEEKYQDKIEDLEENVRKLQRMTTVEGASQEYLKNVVLNYMLSTDIGSKNHMLKAIGAVLRLTPKEVKRVMDHNQAWWWKQNKVATSPTARK